MRGRRDWQTEYIAHLEAELVEARVRISALESREWHRYNAGDSPAVAMPLPGPDPDDGWEYHYDETGLVRSRDRVPSDDV